MQTRKLFIFENFLLLAILFGALWGFWYFEESLFLRIIIGLFSLIGVVIAFTKRKKDSQLSSRRELLMLLILYLGLLTLYNLLYSINFPLYLVMLVVFVLVTILLFSLLSLDQIDTLMGTQIFQVFIVLMALVILEIFLALYFWPIDPESKSLIIVVVFYVVISLIYLYVHSMLRLRRIAGYLIASFLVLGILLFATWFRLAK